MKLNKSKNKGKVHPSPSSSSSPQSPFSSLSNSTQPDPVSTLNHLLPTAILTLISILSLEDKQVLAYMITHSLSSSSSSSSSSVDNSKKKKRVMSVGHKIPCFECGCFDCYTSYWFRWDSSPNRELIHQAIDAFEEHLSNSELLAKSNNKSSRRKDKVKKLVDQKSPASATPVEKEVEEDSTEVLKQAERGESPGKSDEVDVEVEVEVEVEVDESGGAQLVQQQQQQHKGLARKVLPDVIGLFNSRLWNLWGPNV